MIPVGAPPLPYIATIDVCRLPEATGAASARCRSGVRGCASASSWSRRVHASAQLCDRVASARYARGGVGRRCRYGPDARRTGCKLQLSL